MNNWMLHILKNNYRCRSNICDAAQRLITNNPNRYPKETVAVESGGTVVVESFNNPAEEMAFIAKELTADVEWRKHPRNGNESCAILARTNRIVNEYTDYLPSLGIPVAKKKPPVVPTDWRIAKLLLSVLANPYSDFLVHQYLVVHDGKKKADEVKHKAAINMVSINEQLSNRYTMTLDSSILADEHISMESRQRVHDAARKLSEAGEWTIPQLILFLGSMEDANEEVGEGVFLGTAHSGKGREWKNVFLVGCEDELYPGRDDIEESRRLLFVGVTRGEQRVVITYCRHRPQSRGPNVKPGPLEPRNPSRFISEMGLTP